MDPDNIDGYERSAFGSHLLPRMDEYSHGTAYFSPKLLVPSPGEVHLAPPLARYASSSGSVGGDESCVSEHSWTNSQFCASPERTPLPSPMPSPSNYTESLGSHSPMIGTAGALFQGDAAVLPQNLQHYPDTLDMFSQYSDTPRSVPYHRAEISGWASAEQYSPYGPPVVDPALYETSQYEPNQPPCKRSKPSQSAMNTSSVDTSPSQPPVGWSHGSSAAPDANTTTPDNPQPNRTNSSNGKQSPRSKRTSPQGRHSTNGIIFPCTFAPFGCTQTFTAKNEWKRHVATIHLQLGVYICDLGYCGHPPSGSTPASPPAIRYTHPSPKTYNRKDLFTQHLRRMHASPQTKTKLSPDEESAVDAFTRSTSERCFVQQRPAPSYSQCPYCPVDFAGPEIWDDRMEHVARHVEAGTKVLREDEGLREWAVREGVVIEKQRMGEKVYFLVEKAGARKRKA